MIHFIYMSIILQFVLLLDLTGYVQASEEGCTQGEDELCLLQMPKQQFANSWEHSHKHKHHHKHHHRKENEDEEEDHHERQHQSEDEVHGSEDQTVLDSDVEVDSAVETVTNCPNCVFPFVFKQVNYNTCTPVDSTIGPWCGFARIVGTNTKSGWGLCAPGCPGAAAVSSGNAQVTASSAQVIPAVATTSTRYLITNASSLPAVMQSLRSQSLVPSLAPPVTIAQPPAPGGSTQVSTTIAQPPASGDSTQVSPATCSTLATAELEPAQCKFPFKFQGTSYNECTDMSWTASWCGTEAEVLLGSTEGWGLCSKACPGWKELSEAKKHKLQVKSYNEELEKARQDVENLMGRVEKDQRILKSDKEELAEKQNVVKELETKLIQEMGKQKLAMAKSKFEQLKELERSGKEEIDKQKFNIQMITERLADVESQKKIATSQASSEAKIIKKATSATKNEEEEKDEGEEEDDGITVEDMKKAKKKQEENEDDESEKEKTQDEKKAKTNKKAKEDGKSDDEENEEVTATDDEAKGKKKKKAVAKKKSDENAEETKKPEKEAAATEVEKEKPTPNPQGSGQTPQENPQAPNTDEEEEEQPEEQ
eukprot:gnl/TRDRNA2_/TRDRNA2_169151_c0_seq2.p1 gnl/TRDRNA2_/TRDRNA2_169151_c0~~gnl/TRDRNA2_/TRDRNA2_169151_c0_seq2.p1  ORF type:complete len:595 (+),score=185.26 gnl/TRDRNA2_/TRDRNA2_169151_c0_seq2:62-1846(+)